MGSVAWTKRAEGQLAEIWTRTSDRHAVNEAVNEIDRILGSDPENVGESRDRGRRIMFEGPLAVPFRVDSTSGTVYIQDVRAVGTRPGRA